MPARPQQVSANDTKPGCALKESGHTGESERSWPSPQGVISLPEWDLKTNCITSTSHSWVAMDFVFINFPLPPSTWVDF